MIVTTECIYHNPLKEEIDDIVKNTTREHNDKYGHNSHYKHRERGNIQFFGKLENEMKNVWVKGRCLLYQAKRREIAYKGQFEIHKINKFNITIVGSIEKHIINTYLKLNIPVMWRMFSIMIASNGDYICIFCNIPYNSFQKQCFEWYQYNLLENNTALYYEDVGQNNFDTITILFNGLIL